MHVRTHNWIVLLIAAILCNNSILAHESYYDRVFRQTQELTIAKSDFQNQALGMQSQFGTGWYSAETQKAVTQVLVEIGSLYDSKLIAQLKSRDTKTHVNAYAEMQKRIKSISSRLNAISRQFMAEKRVHEPPVQDSEDSYQQPVILTREEFEELRPQLAAQPPQGVEVEFRRTLIKGVAEMRAQRAERKAAEANSRLNQAELERNLRKAPGSPIDVRDIRDLEYHNLRREAESSAREAEEAKREVY